MGAEVGPSRAWGTWEELILGGAVLRHGTRDWSAVAAELRARTLYPFTFTPEACKTKYEDLQKRYSGSMTWFDELKKRRVAELKRELARSEDSIGSLESKIKLLEARNQPSIQVDVTSQTESPLPPLNSNSTESFNKEASKDEQSAGSFTEDTRSSKNWWEHHYQADETKRKPDAMVSSERYKDSSIKELPEAGYGKAVTIRKRRGQRKRKKCNQAITEGSVGESDNLGSSNVVSTVKDNRLTNDCSAFTRNESSCVRYSPGIRDSDGFTHNGSSCVVIKRDNLMEIFESVAETEPAGVFKHRMDSQKRARYRKVIRKHLDMGTIRSRIVGKSIKSAKELFRDLLLLANNALIFYSKRTREYKSAFSLRHLVMKEYKQYCRGSNHEATSAFIPCNPPVKPRSARPRPIIPPPCKDKVLIWEMLLPKTENGIVSTADAPLEELKKPLVSNSRVLLHSSVMGKKGLKRPGKVKSEVGGGDKRGRTSPIKQRKRVRN